MKTKYALIVTLFVILNSTVLILNCFSQWETEYQLTNAPGGSYLSKPNARCLTANGDTLHTVWYDRRDGVDEVYYKRSTNKGTTWEADTRLTNNIGFSIEPSVAVSGSFVHVIWYDKSPGNFEIFYKRSTDGGTTWGADIRLTNDDSVSNHPSVAAFGSNVYVVWEDNRTINWEIFCKLSSDNGTTWGADTRLTNKAGNSYFATVEVFGSNVHIAWYDWRDGNSEIYYKRSTNAGINWEADVRLTNNSFSSFYPSIGISGSNIHIVWFDNREGNNEIYYKRSTNYGVNWGADTRLTNNSGASVYPNIAVSGLNVHFVWHDNSIGNTYKIFYKRSTDGGIYWQAEEQLTSNELNSNYPFIAIAGSSLHVIWIDTRISSNAELYYRRNLTGNIVTEIYNISTKSPDSFSLNQNYPNPFNPTTNIKFSMRNAQFATLKVYDILGKEVATLVNEKLSEGTYSVNWDAAEYPSGVYFYKLITDGYSETKRMLLLK